MAFSGIAVNITAHVSRAAKVPCRAVGRVVIPDLRENRSVAQQ